MPESCGIRHTSIATVLPAQSLRCLHTAQPPALLAGDRLHVARSVSATRAGSGVG